MAEEYGDNLILNPNASTQLEHWTTQGVTRVLRSPGIYCFSLGSTAFMYQELSEADLILKPPDFKIQFEFKLPNPSLGTDVSAYVSVLFGYVGDTIDSFIIPCHPSLLPLSPILSNGWIGIEQICPVNEKLVLRAVRIQINTEDAVGGLEVANIQVRKNKDLWTETIEDVGWADLFRDKSILYGLDADKPILR